MGKIGRKKANKCIGQIPFSNLKTCLLPIIWPMEESQLNVWAFVFAMDYAAVEPVMYAHYSYLHLIYFPFFTYQGSGLPILSSTVCGLGRFSDPLKVSSIMSSCVANVLSGGTVS